MKILKYITIALVFFTTIMSAQEKASFTNDATNKEVSFFKKNMNYQLRAQFSIGGTSPLGIPKEIRKVESYNPTLQLGLEANATKWFSDEQQWGIRLGVRFEGKGMTTKAQVKGYLTEIIQDGQKVRGYYTGKVKTTVKNTYITFPISAVYKINHKWNVYGGVYFSGLIDKNFDGYVSDGYLRQNVPNGQKITFEGDSQAAYDFSEEVRRFQWGTQFGGEWTFNQHFKLFADMTYGFNGVLKSDFDAISFSMHNIYLNLGFGYQF
ncbi:porin family protein [Myroides injenensis]|uniref:porin family protein n=1 Tax=Myroides injenensis TaxID=1183151 RepID=UPI000474B374|nr:porin family protein [Myroides injenensis]